MGEQIKTFSLTARNGKGDSYPRQLYVMIPRSKTYVIDACHQPTCHKEGPVIIPTVAEDAQPHDYSTILSMIYEEEEEAALKEIQRLRLEVLSDTSSPSCRPPVSTPSEFLDSHTSTFSCEFSFQEKTT